MPTDVDVVVIGAGLAGSGSAWASARRGHSVMVFEQFPPGHKNGSSHGSARIVRRGYSDPLYVQLTGRAFDLWAQIEAESGVQLLRLLGGLDFGPDRPVAQIAESFDDAGVPHEVLTAAAAEQRWPGMRFTGPVLYHAQAGVVDAELAVSTLLDLAAASGAQIRHGSRVTGIEPGPTDATVRLDDGSSVRARRVVVAAGGWVGPLLDGLIALPPLRVTRQRVFHFPRRSPADPPWPSVIHEDGHRMYHLAGGRDGDPGDARKIAEHDPGPISTAGSDAIDAEYIEACRARVVEYVRRWLPGLEPEPRDEANCLYTTTTSEDFLIDVDGPLVVCSPCSGHGAKFAPLVGELVAGLVDGSAGVPDRFRLQTHAHARPGTASL